MLQSLNIVKASGQDGISARMLRATTIKIALSITKPFNLSIQLGQPPTVWKSSNVVPIPKKQGAKNPNEFRPISLLPILSKVLEKHFHSLISGHICAPPLYITVNGASNLANLLLLHCCPPLKTGSSCWRGERK